MSGAFAKVALRMHTLQSAAEAADRGFRAASSVQRVYISDCGFDLAPYLFFSP